MKATNLHHAQAQADKAAKLVVAIDTLCLDAAVDPHKLAEGICEVLANWDAGKWNALALLHGIKPPSEEVQAMVLEVFAMRALSRSNAAAPVAPVLQLVKGGGK